MIRIRSSKHLSEIHRALREGQGWTRRQLAVRLHYAKWDSIKDRESGRVGIATDPLIATAGLFGFDLALVPRPDPVHHLPAGWRRTGTGWPG